MTWQSKGFPTWKKKRLSRWMASSLSSLAFLRGTTLNQRHAKQRRPQNKKWVALKWDLCKSMLMFFRICFNALHVAQVGACSFSQKINQKSPEPCCWCESWYGEPLKTFCCQISQSFPQERPRPEQGGPIEFGRAQTSSAKSVRSTSKVQKPFASKGQCLQNPHS